MKALNLRLNYFYVALSFLIMKIAWVSTAWSWGRTLGAFGHNLPYRDIYIIYFRSMVAKYVPGKVWHIAGSTYIAAQKGVPEGPAIASVVIGQAYSVLSGIALVIAALAFGVIKHSGESFALFRWTSIPVLAFLLVLVVKPNLTGQLMNWVLRIFKRETVTMRINISTSLRLFLLFLFPWFLFGLSFWFLAQALTPVPFSQYLSLAVINVAGTVIGFLAFFAPGGIGVKEASTGGLLASLTAFPVSFALALAFGFRIVTSIVELIAFGLTWVVEGIQKRR